MQAPETPRQFPGELEPLLSIAEVRAVLRVSESTLYRLMRSGEIVPVRIGGRTLFSPKAVRQFIADRGTDDHAQDVIREQAGGFA